MTADLTVVTTHQERFAGVSIAGVSVGLFTWLVAAGFSLRQSFLSTGVILTVTSWGFLTIWLLARCLLRTGNIGLWMAGPSLGIGAMVLLVLRAATPEYLFLVLLPIAPLVLVTIGIWRISQDVTRRSCLRRFSTPEPFDFFVFWTLIGVSLLTPVRLVGGWAWVSPIVGFAIITSLLMLLFHESPKGSQVLLAIVLAVAVTIWSIGQRSSNWWRVAEGIPFDETILETISNGLVKWGPTVNPLHHELGGASALAYHHLLYLIIGLINRVAGPEPYQALLIAGPVLIGVSIVASLFLLFEFFIKASGKATGGRFVQILVVAVCLINLDNDGTGGPSSWFGIASLLGSLLILLQIISSQSSRGALGLFSLSLATVSFSKGPFLWMPVALAVILSILAWKKHWKLATSAVLVGACLTLWLSSSNVLVPTYQLSFWPYQTMASDFSFNVYTFLVFWQVLIFPIVLALPCIALMAVETSQLARRLALALAFVLVMAIGFRLFIDADWPNAAQIFYDAGAIAATIAVLGLVAHLGPPQKILAVGTISAFVFALILVVTSRRFESETLNAQNLGSAIILLVLLAQLLFSCSGFSARQIRKITLPVCSMLVIALLATQYLADVHSLIPERIGAAVTTRYEDWYGNDDFSKLVDFVNKNSDDSELFAYQLGAEASMEDHEIDYRPAALMSRRFLTLHPLFKIDETKNRPQLWADVRAVRQIGEVDARTTLDYLSERGVVWLIVSRSSTDGEWLKAVGRAGSRVAYSNHSFILIRIP